MPFVWQVCSGLDETIFDVETKDGPDLLSEACVQSLFRVSYSLFRVR